MSDEVINRLSVNDRREELRKIIREVGLWNLPGQRKLAERYGVSQTMIRKDLGIIIKTINPNQLVEVFHEFFNANIKAQEEIRKIMRNGSSGDKLKAMSTMLSLQDSMTKLLENYGHKERIAEKINVENNGLDLLNQRLQDLEKKDDK